jgi:hypothetical protein
MSAKVLSLLNGLNTKCSRLDFVPICLLEECATTVSALIDYLVNCSLSQATSLLATCSS